MKNYLSIGLAYLVAPFVIVLQLLDPIFEMLSLNLFQRRWLKYHKRINKLLEEQKENDALELCEEVLCSKDYLHHQTHVYSQQMVLRKTILLARLNEFEKSEEAIKNFERLKIYIEDPKKLIEADYNYAKFIIAKNKNDFELSEKYIKNAIKLMQDSEHHTPLEIIPIRLELVTIYIAMSKIQKAINEIDNLEKQIVENNDYKKNEIIKIQHVRILGYKAFLFNTIHNLEKAKSIYQEAFLIIDRYDLRDEELASLMIGYSTLMCNLGFTKKATDIIFEAKLKYGDDDQNIIRAEFMLADRMFVSKNYEESLDLFLGIFKKDLSNYYTLTNEKIRLRAIVKIIVIYTKLQQYLKSLEYLEILNFEYFIILKESVSNLSDTDVLHYLSNSYEILLGVFEVLDDYKNLPLKYRTAIYNSRLLTKSIIENYYAKSAPHHTTLVQSLDPDSIIVDIIKIEPSTDSSPYYVAFIVDDDIQILRLAKEQEMEELYRNSYQKNLDRKSLDVETFKGCWLKIDQQTSHKSKIYLSTEGIYNLIEVSNLLTPRNKYYFEEKTIYRFHNFLSEVQLSETENSDVVILGNPNFEGAINGDLSNTNGSNNDKNKSLIKLLPFSEVEGKIIAEILESHGHNPIQLYWDDASKENIVNINNPRVIHLSTHGFDEEMPEGEEEDLEWDELTGLLLSNAIVKTDGELYKNIDGVIFTKEIKELNLIGTKLGTLGSCFSGMEITLLSISLGSLQRAFFLAGVHCLLVALWEIEDKVAQEFMVAFYTEWVKEENSDKALSVARECIKEKYVHPFYWAGFRIVHNSLQTIMRENNVKGN